MRRLGLRCVGRRVLEDEAIDVSANILAARIRFVLVAILTVTSAATEVKLDGRSFTIPEGFTIERIAGPPLVDRPITAAFDDGRASVCR